MADAERTARLAGWMDRATAAEAQAATWRNRAIAAEATLLHQRTQTAMWIGSALTSEADLRRALEVLRQVNRAKLACTRIVAGMRENGPKMIVAALDAAGHVLAEIDPKAEARS